ncbi:Aste57867_9497 [Aphanomyces stellatus]|uniref:Aste57867_9497 protein n=1 Tax=Aphanomyces stellatus TaxID=120398 RepID=A0A485KNI8_9STRA|nr:hypothetical protein As57867_009460 [Aphanomyces stellatus]VFT86376.1 Aste57867_9497 [Aphanomyces stellatus]
MDKLTDMTSVPPTPSASDFQVDFKVLQESSSLFQSGPKWVWRRFVLQGQRLTMFDMIVTSPLMTIQLTTHVTLQPQSGHQYLLQDNGKTILTLFCPSRTRFLKFDSVLRLAASTPSWTRPLQPVFQELVDVATIIVETDQADAPLLSSNGPPNVTAAHVATYVDHLKSVYDIVLALPTQTALYEYLLQLEAAYLVDRGVRNFAHTVHMHYAVDYGRSRTDRTWIAAQDDYSVCPHTTCRRPVPPEIAFLVRVAGAAKACPGCGGTLSSEVFRLAAFRRDHPTVPHGRHNNVVQMPLLPPQTSFKRYLNRVAETLQAQKVHSSDMEAINRTIVAYLQRLDLVAAMARHLVFASIICGNAAYWRHPTVQAASVVRYRHFCALTNERKTRMAWMPTIDIALVRYAHQTTTKTPLSFFDLPSKEGYAAAYAETFLLWAETSPGPYSSFAPSYDAFVTSKAHNNILKQPFLKKKWDTFHWVPSRDCRFVGVDEGSGQAIAVAVAVDAQNDTRDAPPTATEYVAVIGTPLMDNRVQPPNEAAVIKGTRGGDVSIFDTIDPMSFYIATDVGVHAVMLFFMGLLSLFS